MDDDEETRTAEEADELLVGADAAAGLAEEEDLRAFEERRKTKTRSQKTETYIVTFFSCTPSMLEPPIDAMIRILRVIIMRRSGKQSRTSQHCHCAQVPPKFESTDESRIDRDCNENHQPNNS